METTQELNMLQWAAQFMIQGGIFMWVILAVWVVGVAAALERWKAYKTYYVDGTSFMGEVKKLVLNNQITEAIQFCSGSKSLMALVLKNGLKRAGAPKDQVEDALESSILEVVPQVEKRLAFVSLMSNVSTLFGLLGTIQGLIDSFSAVAGADAAEKAKLLASGISVAMNTTALGLLSAISLMFIHAWLSGRAETMINQIQENSVKLIDLFNAKKAYSSSSNDKAA